jgi:ribulose 1,5-bisphosphate synthetase/thiazole synthase
MTNLKPVDVAVVGGRWRGLAMAKEITTRSGLNVVVLRKNTTYKRKCPSSVSIVSSNSS